MEDNKEKDFDDKSMSDEDFKDFDEEENALPEIDEDIANSEPEEDMPLQEENVEEFAPETSDIPSEETIQEEIAPKETQEVAKEIAQEGQQGGQQEVSPWEELDGNNSVVKKYIFYVSKDFVPYIDKLTTDERSAYINDAIQIKVDLENEQKQKQLKKKLVTHFILMCLAMCLFAPIALFVAHKAILATFDNYKYSQENFEKLYKSRFEKDRAYMRSIQYNKEQELKKKKQ